MDEIALLRKAGIERALLDDPRASVPVDRVHALVYELLARTGDAALGLDAARHYHPETFGLLGAVVAFTPTVREVIQLFIQYTHLTYTFFHVSLEEKEGRGRLTFVADGELGGLHRFYLDREFAFVAQTARNFWPDSYRDIVRCCAFDYPEPIEIARYRERFACPLVFGAAEAVVTGDFSGDRSNVGGNALGLGVLRDHLHAFATPKREGDDLIDRVRREITLSVTSKRTLPDGERIATTLGLSGRELRRRLLEHRTSFRAISDEVIAPLAKRWLRDSALSVADVAERVGYAEAASFVRAFRRWTGTTPEAFRAAKTP